ncbi:helix-turn-helix domain-containing protein [Streptomyces triticagri]|uniref:Helix-turn-helix domain-containing protein n=2 Tax=Streptomyces triticagri TaxID=2293568 RepID=A0A372LXR7_9ACTN|nr:helix-turn-helix domain-containing protein [Streptomyces triticagri]
MGLRIQSLRRRARLSQQDLADRADLSTRALRDIERGRVSRPHLRTVQRIAAALGLPDQDVRELHEAARSGPPRISSRFRVHILGPLQVLRGDVAIEVHRPMLRRLLGLLALRRPHAATQEEIVDTLWPSGPPHSYRSLIHTYVSQVRQLLEPPGPSGGGAAAVERVPGGYRLRAESGQSDLARFQDLLARAKRSSDTGDPQAAKESLALALDCWRGPVLSDLDPVFGQHPIAVLVAEQRVEATVLHADLCLALGCPEQAVAELRERAGTAPLHEGVHARLMLALAGCGEQAAALSVFAAFRGRLDDQLGITPGQEIREAHLRVLRQQIPLAKPRPDPSPAPDPAPGTGHDRPYQLPAHAASYTGRARQLAELDGLLSDRDPAAPTVVAIVGPPGVGKTALALRWAQARREHFEDGQLFADLRGHSPLPALRPVDVLARFLRALGVPPDRVPAGEEEAAAMYRTLLAGRRMLVVLDNAGGAEQVRPLLPGSSTCRVVITSRSGLSGLVATEGARRLGLDVLDLSEARALLGRLLGEERAAAEPQAVARLAQLCGWLPLALRIAAANLSADPSASVAAYCAELAGGSLIDGLRLEGDKQPTVKAAFDLSYLALPAAARRTFRLLSLMPGSDITGAGTAALIGAGPVEAGRLLRRLTHSHLVQEVAPGRFGLHDLLRTYARELVGEQEQSVVRRLLDWYLARASAADAVLFPDGPGRWALDEAETAADTETEAKVEAETRPADLADASGATAWLTAERENLVSTVQYAAAAGHPTVAWRLAQSLHGFLSLGMHSADRLAVAKAGLAAAVVAGGRRPQAAARLLLADCHWAQGWNAEAREEYARALELAEQAGWQAGQAMALRRIGTAHQENGAMRQASLHLSRARELTPSDGGPGAAEDVLNLGLICWKLGQLDQAAEHCRQAAGLYEALGAPAGAAVARTNLGIVLRALGRPAEAITLLDRALAVHTEAGNRASETVALSCLATAHVDTGDQVRGLRLAQQSVASAQALENRRLEANSWFSMGAAQERAGHAGAGDSYRMAAHLAALVNDRFPQASALVGLAGLALRHDDPEQARLAADEAAALAEESEFRVLQATALHVSALVRVRLGDSAAALREAGFAMDLHRATGHRPGAARGHMALAAAHAIRGEDAAAFRHRREGLRLFREMGLAGFRDYRPVRADAGVPGAAGRSR